MKYLSLLIAFMSITVISQAKIWRINNNAGVVADFTTFHAAVNSASVLAGDSLYFEPSATDYATNSMTLNKRLIVIGPGYFLDPANASIPGNAGLQVATKDARIPFIRMSSGANGSKFLGITLSGSVYVTGISNVSFEKCFFAGGLYFEDGACTAITVRKCYLSGTSISASGTATLSNFVCENSIFNNNGYINLTILTGSDNIVRNNSVINGGNAFTLVNTYFANNIIGAWSQCDLTNCTIKNNLFQANQTLPGTATNNLVNQDMATIYTGTGSFDARCMLKTGSPAIGAGLTVGAVTNPDCGAFGGTDPYKLSGIPNIPSIYSLTVPTSIPSGSATMNITFSTRNNN
ncbi:hypothetical protein HB364_09545 [Pseudoflavitalea sp. X16]|uniref:hypothetical protein n=1 Tax=Paraflavitalea devenefica TaxID=2716334 RepID=UPI001421399A|nr:hypothetical protein [Paraflavitalea devenefica]NII25325.1 hypothetical protein [Paraflavitalea devenefica]